jgi:hypothetical protein
MNHGDAMTDYVAFRHDCTPDEHGRLYVPMKQWLFPEATEPCPDCDGKGWGWSSLIAEKSCPTCDGSGQVPVPWLHVAESCADDYYVTRSERRLAGLWTSGPPTVLPVIAPKDDYPDEFPYIVAYDPPDLFFWNPGESFYDTKVLDEPWAADLEPGDTVWQFDVTPCDPTVTLQSLPVGPYVGETADFPLAVEPYTPTRIETP